MGFDDLRPKRAQVYDTWGKIGSRHGAETLKPAAAQPEDDLQDGSACPQCAHPLTWIVTNRCHESQSEQLGCHACGERFGESFP